MSKEVAKAGEFGVDLSNYAGMSGFEETGADTYKTPFLKILQGLSHEVSPNDAAYIEGAIVGQFCNSATQELYDELNVVVLKVSHELVVWKPNRGGFVGSFPKAQEKEVVARVSGVQKWDKDGNDVIDTISLFCMNADSPADIFILPLSVTSFKHGRNFATKLRLLKDKGKPVGVSWAGVWNLKTVEESNARGRWYSIGSTPTFSRFVDGDEVSNAILPALELLETAIVDHGASAPDSVSPSTVVDEEF